MNRLVNIQPTRMIDLGCGTGLISENLIVKYPYAECHAIDMAENLLLKATTRLTNSVHVYAADFDCLPSVDHQFDLAFSNMALQWSVDFSHTIKEIARILCSQGLLAFSLPLPGTFSELNKNSVNYFLDYSSITRYLHQHGYKIIDFFQETHTPKFPNLISALYSIKNVGANFYFYRRHNGLRNNNDMKSLTEATLTYVIGYFIAKKK